MNRRMTNLMGISLVLLGAVALLNSTIFNWMGINGELWPLLLTAVGLGLVAAPFLFENPRPLSPLFIPGFPLLMVSALLLWSSFFSEWDIWSRFWPMILLALALGLALTAVFMRVVWFLVPAVQIGVTGMLLQFTAATGWWGTWAILWPGVLLGTGLALLIPGHLAQRHGLVVAGTILSIVACAAFVMMTIILSSWASVLGAVILIGSGSLLVLRGFVAQRPLALTNSELKEKLPTP